MSANSPLFPLASASIRLCFSTLNWFLCALSPTRCAAVPRVFYATRCADNVHPESFSQHEPALASLCRGGPCTVVDLILNIDIVKQAVAYKRLKASASSAVSATSTAAPQVELTSSPLPDCAASRLAVTRSS